MLLAADFDADIFNKVGLNVEVEIFTTGVNGKIRFVAHGCHLGIGFQDSRSHFFGDDVLLRQHQNVRFIAVKESLITVLDIVVDAGLNQILHYQRIRRSLDFTAMNFFRHRCLLE